MGVEKIPNLRPVVKGQPIEPTWRHWLAPDCPYETADVGPQVQVHRTVRTTSFSGSQGRHGEPSLADSGNSYSAKGGSQGEH